MNSISDQQLLEWNKLGLIPGPLEDELAYQARVHYCLQLKESINKDMGSTLSMREEELAPAEILQPALQKVSQLYDISPSWIPLFFSNSQLAPWHGGCAWIFQQSDTSPTSAFFQLRSSFKKSDTYLGIYKREELIAHEVCHVGRMVFEEPKFEEFIAYQTSSSSWRRSLGPLIQSSWESALFVLILFLILMLDLSIFLWGNDTLYHVSLWIKLIPIALIGIAWGRLRGRQIEFTQCLNRLQNCVKDPFKARSILYRLTDQEILLFSHSSPSEITDYVKQESSFRWRLIKLAYF